MTVRSWHPALWLVKHLWNTKLTGSSRCIFETKDRCFCFCWLWGSCKLPEDVSHCLAAASYTLRVLAKSKAFFNIRVSTASYQLISRDCSLSFPGLGQEEKSLCPWPAPTNQELQYKRSTHTQLHGPIFSLWSWEEKAGEKKQRDCTIPKMFAKVLYG